MNPERVVISIAILLGICSVIFAVFGYHNGEDFYANLATEFASIVITVLVIDRIYKWRDFKKQESIKTLLKTEEKKKTIRQMSSPSNGFALEAVRILEDEGWLRDGSLKDIHLNKANLRKAPMPYANLSGAHFSQVDLQGASLTGSNLSGTNWWRCELNNTVLFKSIFRRAKLEKVEFENAWLCQVDFSDASFERISCKDAKYDQFTIWPKGFDPQKAGAKKMRQIKISETKTRWEPDE